MAKKNITIDDLADLMQKGFVKVEKDTDKKIDDLAVMMQKGFNGVDKRFNGVATKDELKDMRSEMNKRFDKIESLILVDHKKRIEKLETEVKELKEMFAV